MLSEECDLEISRDKLSSLIDDVAGLARSYWETIEARASFPATDGAQTTALFSRPWLEDGIGRDVLKTFETIAAHSRPGNSRFFGYVFGSGEPVGALSELLIAALNQNVTSWRAGPAATVIEQSVVGWLAEAIGCPGFRGSLCGGGSTANLMGLAIAREAKLPANQEGARPGTLYCSTEAHFSIPKAIALLGTGRSNLRLIETDEKMRMRPDALAREIAEDRRHGRIPVAIIATVGTVVSGAIDPLPEIAVIAREEDIWLHADGAFGALAALAVPDRFTGLDLVDSLSLDAHKWLYQTVDCSCLLYRDPLAARAAFSHNADYVRAFSEDPTEAYLFFDESIELSRRFRALKLWMSLQYHGRRAFRKAILRDLNHAELLAKAVEAHPDLELLAPVSLSAVCFRHRYKNSEAILRRVVTRGRVYLSNAKVGGRFALRACFVNHRTSEEVIPVIVDEVLSAAAEINSEIDGR